MDLGQKLHLPDRFGRDSRAGDIASEPGRRRPACTRRARGGKVGVRDRHLALDRGVPYGDVPEVGAAWVTWLRTFRWDWFATCAFGHPTSPARALSAVEDWLRPLGPRTYAAVGLQTGPQGDRLHVHAVIGGTGRHPLRESFLRESWRRGSLDLKGYGPAKGGIEYLVRQAHAIELVGTPVPYRPRR